MQTAIFLTVVGVAILSSLWQPVSSHGRLISPPSRSSMWRFGFNTEKNYQDNELFCGGFSHQVSLGYKCGICGDPWDGERHNEANGKYAKGIIVDTYKQGATINITVDLTANHKGWFEFKICPTNDYKVKATQECLDLYPLQLADRSGTKLNVAKMGSTKIHSIVTLPESLTCEFCVLQWHYHAGNNWGKDPDGKACVGCGYQEEFYGCADVQIIPREGSSTPTPTSRSTSTSGSSGKISWSKNKGAASGVLTKNSISPTKTTTAAKNTATTTSTTTTSTHPTTTSPAHNTTATTSSTTTTAGHEDNGVHILLCEATQFIPGLTEWCNANCNLNFCPESHCKCVLVPEPRASREAKLPPGCYATTPFINWPGMDRWCSYNCLAGSCPDQKCFCKF